MIYRQYVMGQLVTADGRHEEEIRKRTEIVIIVDTNSVCFYTDAVTKI